MRHCLPMTLPYTPHQLCPRGPVRPPMVSVWVTARQVAETSCTVCDGKVQFPAPFLMLLNKVNSTRVMRMIPPLSNTPTHTCVVSVLHLVLQQIKSPPAPFGAFCRDTGNGEVRRGVLYTCRKRFSIFQSSRVK
jgi:hypothetical protein